MPSPTYFVTGITGFLGSEYLSTALKADKDAQFYCLIRGSSQAHAEKRLGQILQQLGLAHETTRVFAQVGDIAEDQLGLNTDTYHALAQKITHILHAAATVGFSKPKDLLAQANIGGTQHIIHFAHTCVTMNPRFQVLGYVSTAYVAGKYTGAVAESDFKHPHGFKNNYESTKFAAEHLLHCAKPTLPVIIFRPSIILGHSEDGNTARSSEFFELAQAFKTCAVSLLPMNKSALLDAVSVDYVANSMYFLLQDNQAVGQTFHLSCGLGQELRVEQVVEVLNQTYQTRFRTIPAVFWRLVRPLLILMQAKRMLKQMDTFWPYTVANPQFSNQFTQEQLKKHQVFNDNPLETWRKTLAFQEISLPEASET